MNLFVKISQTFFALLALVFVWLLTIQLLGNAPPSLIAFSYFFAAWISTLAIYGIWNTWK
jgi:hypothetical protein